MQLLNCFFARRLVYCFYLGGDNQPEFCLRYLFDLIRFLRVQFKLVFNKFALDRRKKFFFLFMFKMAWIWATVAKILDGVFEAGWILSVKLIF
jgi:hypothetical protein